MKKKQYTALAIAVLMAGSVAITGLTVPMSITAYAQENEAAVSEEDSEPSADMEEDTNISTETTESATQDSVESEARTEDATEEVTEESTEEVTITEEEATQETMETEAASEVSTEDGSDDIVASGTCGDNLNWAIANGVLTIQGTGKMIFPVDEENDNNIIVPWEGYTEEITKVVMEEGVSSIAKNAFCYMSLDEVIIPGTVTSIDSWAFYACEVSEITIPSGVTEIKTYTFASCDSLENIVIPNTVTTIEAYAFDSCESLKTITIPASVTKIGTMAYGYNNEEFDVDPESGLQYSDIMIRGYTNSAAYGYAIQNDIAFESIGEVEAANPSEIASGTFGDNIKWTLDDQGTLTLSGSGAMPELTYKENEHGDSFWYAPWSEYASYISNVVIEKGITSIADYAFEDVSGMISVSLPEGVTKIGTCAFESALRLKEINLPSTLTSIGDEAFSYCASLKEVNIPSKVTSIGEKAFYVCSGLTKVTLPPSITVIKDSTFACCYALTGITIPGKVKTIEYGALGWCKKLTKISIPSSVKTIGEASFAGCESLTSVSISSNVKTIGESAFDSCPKLKTVKIPLSATSIGAYAFGYGDDGELVNNFTISGYYVSAANKYADANNIKFKGIKNPNAKMVLPTIPSNKLFMKVGQSSSGLKVTGMLSGDSVKSVKSSAASVVAVSNVKSNGATLKAKKTGTAKITITLKSGLSKIFSVSVQKTTVKTKQITGLAASVSVKKGKTTVLKPVKVPFTSQQRITYKSSKTSVAAVTSSGKITGKKKGTAYITVKSGSVSKKVKVTVK